MLDFNKVIQREKKPTKEQRNWNPSIEVSGSGGQITRIQRPSKALRIRGDSEYVHYIRLSQFDGIGVHSYGKVGRINLDTEEKEEFPLSYRMNSEQARRFNEYDNPDNEAKRPKYKAGDETLRFWSEDEVIEIGKERIQQLFNWTGDIEVQVFETTYDSYHNRNPRKTYQLRKQENIEQKNTKLIDDIERGLYAGEDGTVKLPGWSTAWPKDATIWYLRQQIKQYKEQNPPEEEVPNVRDLI